MALKTFSIHIEKTAGSLADTMNSIRSWLDNHRIEPLVFKSRSTEGGGVAYDIAFKTEDEADLFERDFRTRSERLVG